MNGETEKDKERIEDLRFKMLCRDVENNKTLLAKEIDRIEKLREQGELSREKALELKAKEYEIHFEKLNGEWQRLIQMQETYTLRETSQKSEKTLEGEIRKLEDTTVTEFNKMRFDIADEFSKLRRNELKPLQDWQSNQQGRSAIILLIWGLAVALIMFGLNKLIN